MKRKISSAMLLLLALLGLAGCPEIDQKNDAATSGGSESSSSD